MGNIGYWLDRYDAEAAELLRLGEPPVVLVGTAAWDHVGEIHAACGTNPWVILRWVELHGNTTWPAEMVAERLAREARRWPHIRCILHGLNEPDVSGIPACDAVVAWELTFIRRCHELGYPTICLNLAYGNPPGDEMEMLLRMQRLRPVHDASDWVGLHLYMHHDAGGWGDYRYYSQRYRLWPHWFDTGKLISTETGVESPGWRTQGLSEREVTRRMLENSRAWHNDGVAAAVWFLLANTSSDWDGYRPTREMVRRFVQEAAPANLDKEVEEMTQSDAHRIYDLWARSVSGEGYNPDTALGKYWQKHPEVGLPTTPERATELNGEAIVWRGHTGGILVYRVRDGRVAFCRTEKELANPFD
jgi:hypothetical protein